MCCMYDLAVILWEIWQSEEESSKYIADLSEFQLCNSHVNLPGIYMYMDNQSGNSVTYIIISRPNNIPFCLVIQLNYLCKYSYMYAWCRRGANHLLNFLACPFAPLAAVISDISRCQHAMTHDDILHRHCSDVWLF